MNEWNNFFVAVAGAAAGLTGLLFVGISISLNKILSIRELPDRALLSLTLLLNVLVLAILFLVPELRIKTSGICVLSAGIFIWIAATMLDFRNIKYKPKPYRKKYLFNVFLNQAAAGCFIAAGAILLTGKADGIYWIVPAIIISILKAVIDCWVLLIEINR